MLLKQLELSNFIVYCYIVGCEETGEGVVIDPASDAPLIVETAKEMGVDKIKHIVFTHGHADHTMAAGKLKELTGASIIIHKADKKIMTITPGVIFKAMGGEKPPSADITVEDGDIVSAGDSVRLRVIHTPGHSPGGMCLYTPGYVFTGDTLFVLGIGRTDLPGASLRTLEKSVTEKLFSLPDDTVVLPGHNYGPKPTSTIGMEKEMNPFF